MASANAQDLLDLSPLGTESFVVEVFLKQRHLRKVFQEIIAPKLRSDEFRKARISLVQPASWRDSVRDIGKSIKLVNTQHSTGFMLSLRLTCQCQKP